jgi:UDP-N-acetylmuramoylalanine--D-glutamate ligase
MGKNVVVVGLARTGIALARFLKDRGAKVTATDAQGHDELGPYAKEALNLGIPLELGGHTVESFVASDLIVVSPGVPEKINPIEVAMEAGVPVIGEIELAARFITEPIVAITGTNGKTTTTTLVGNMLEASGRRAFVGGNIGAPLIDYVHAGMEADVVVAEISSFQLDTTEQFRPKVATLLNVSEDHLDRYIDFSDYLQSKGRIFRNQRETDAAILNGMDSAVAELDRFITSQKLYFDIDTSKSWSGRNLRYGASIQGHELICRLPTKDSTAFDLSNLKIKGQHNLENVAAAALTALMAGGEQGGVQAAIDQFEGLPHRLEQVRTIGGVTYYNDSKATNVDAVKRSLESFQGPIILIMGGRDKGGSYSALMAPIKERVKGLVVFGEACEKILSSLGALTRSQRAHDLAEAVGMAHEAGVSGDVVLLAPGCSSFDVFADYAERGRAFRQAVERLS